MYITLTGINLNEVNQETVHTTPNCTMEGVSRMESGYVQSFVTIFPILTFFSQERAINQLRRQGQRQRRLWCPL